jgi:hypothetical protein
MRNRQFNHAMAAILIAVLIALAATPTWADVIDGQWCLASSSFEIEGRNIRTPAGSQVRGNYTRHSFTYVVPQTEAGAGSEIAMLLRNEETVELVRKLAGAVSPPEIWKRCKPTS